jgi:hypothetical protein
MQIQAHIDAEALICEVMRYLAVVDAFRAERCEPMWRPEPVPSDALPSASRVSYRSGSRPSGTRRP